jgi:hypothetical protein
MPFRGKVADDALVACARRCCICRRFCGKRINLHHIKPEAEGGPDTLVNCIPLCLDCHEEVGSYNATHPIGRKFGEDELRRHRDLWFEFVANHPERLTTSNERLFSPTFDLRSEVQASVEPHYYEATLVSPEKGARKEEVFGVKIRNKGSRDIFVDEIGFTCGDKRYKGLFSPYGGRFDSERNKVIAGDSQVYSFWQVEMEDDDVAKIDGLYLLTGSGDFFMNQHDCIERLRSDFLAKQEIKTSEQDVTPNA